MKHADVVIGETYLARVSGDLVPVIPTREVTRYQHGYRNAWMKAGGSRTWKMFTVIRADNGVVLPKPRRASALRTLEDR